MATHYRCNGCREWVPDREACKCGHARPKHNTSLRTAMLNNHLFKQAEQAERG